MRELLAIDRYLNCYLACLRITWRNALDTLGRLPECRNDDAVIEAAYLDKVAEVQSLRKCASR